MKVYNHDINDFEPNVNTNLISQTNTNNKTQKDTERKLSNLSDFYFKDGTPKEKNTTENEKAKKPSSYFEKSSNEKTNDIKGLILLIFSVFKLNSKPELSTLPRLVITLLNPVTLGNALFTNRSLVFLI